MSPASSSWSARYCRFLSRWATAVLAIGFAVFVGAMALVWRLELRTAFSELLPHDDPGVVALQKTQARIGDLSLLLVGVRSPDREANLRYAEVITNKLRALPPTVCALATYHVKDLKKFFDDNKWLYVAEADLETIRDRLRSEITKRKNPLLVDLSDGEESVDSLRKRLADKDQLGGRFPGGTFSNKEGTYVWIAALPPGGIFGERTGEELWRAALGLLEDEDPTRYHPEMKTHITGPVATAVANRQVVERDIVWVTATCVVIVALSIALYFRKLRSIPLIGIPALFGTVMAFATASLAFGYVNSSTAFLGSIILGNGINYAIIFMARYQEERASGMAPAAALEATIGGALKGTAVAAVCASAAYASLTLTSFRGFYQFGVMGAVGVLFCWIATFTLLPSLLVTLDRRAALKEERTAPASLALLGRALDRRAAVLLVVSVALAVLSVRGILHFAKAPFEYDFRKLNARLPTTEVQQDFYRNQNTLFGRWPQPTIVLADDVSQLGAIEATVRRQDTQVRGPNVIGQIVTIYDVLPGTPEVQRRKLEIIGDIRKLVKDPALEGLDEKERTELAQIDPPETLRILEPKDIPPLARRPFTEVDGTIGKVVLVYVIEHGLSVWNGRDMLRIADVLQRLELDDGHVIETSGHAVVFSAMLRSILRDGPIATWASLIVVLVLTLLIMRPLRAALMAMISLVVGVIWMVGAAGAAEVKITFLNFIALPITFGIGAEYAINVVARYQQGRNMVRAVASTGGAVALCSWTTIVGYGSLLAAQNRALQGFGAMAILGEVACLLAAIVALPAFVLWRQRRVCRVAEADEPPPAVEAERL